uniref:Uncharacterized protein n=1 Tax=Arundo donax TaxID=35708 RepID=A0A0A9EV56_ARUDO
MIRKKLVEKSRFHYTAPSSTGAHCLRNHLIGISHERVVGVAWPCYRAHICLEETRGAYRP